MITAIKKAAIKEAAGLTAARENELHCVTYRKAATLSMTKGKLLVERVCFTFVGRFIRYSLWRIFQAAKGFDFHSCSHLPLSQTSRKANTDDDPKRVHIIPDCFNRLPTTLLHAPSAAPDPI